MSSLEDVECVWQSGQLNKHPQIAVVVLLVAAAVAVFDLFYVVNIYCSFSRTGTCVFMSGVAFNSARGYSMERKNYLDDLLSRGLQW